MNLFVDLMIKIKDYSDNNNSESIKSIINTINKENKLLLERIKSSYRANSELNHYDGLSKILIYSNRLVSEEVVNKRLKNGSPLEKALIKIYYDKDTS